MMDLFPEEEEVEVDLSLLPTLRTVPVLPEDYPLFSWEDWPDSLAALVPGGLTKNFEKACWNAMVDTFTEAVAAAGLPFHREEEGLTPEHLKITKGKYGRLLATTMNTFVDVIDDVVQLPWQWSYDRDRRGYLGWYQGEPRNSFRGSSWTNRYPEKNLPSDVVYPEYLLDLARRINLIIELMRDTYPYIQELSGRGLCSSLAHGGVRRGVSGPISRRMILPLLISSTPLRVGTGVPTALEWISRLNVAFPAELLKSASVGVRMPILSPIRSGAEVKPAATATLRGVYARSCADALVEKIFPADLYAAVSVSGRVVSGLQSAEGIALSAVCWNWPLEWASAAQVPGVNLSARMLTGFTRSVGADVRPGVPTAVKGSSHSLTRAAASSGRMVNTKASHCAASSARAEARTGILEPLSASHPAHSGILPNLISEPLINVQAQQPSVTGRQLTVIKGRTRPGWVDHKSRILAMPGLEHLESAMVFAGQGSGSRSLCSLGTAWEPPIWHADGLWIRQVKIAKMRPDGTLDLSGSGDPVSAAQKSAVAAVAALGTLWLAPVWVDGGLYIRQVRDASVLEDGSLDLTGGGEEMALRQSSMVSSRVTLDTAWYAPSWVNGGLYLQQARTPKRAEDGDLDLSDSGDPIAAREVSSVTVGVTVSTPQIQDEWQLRQSGKVNAFCALDTGWYPPEAVDGGLLIRQAQEAEQTENGALEVR